MIKKPFYELSRAVRKNPFKASTIFRVSRLTKTFSAGCSASNPRKKAEECYKYEPAWSNIFLLRHLKYCLKRPYALPLIQEIELFIYGKDFDQRCAKTDSICIKFNLFALHVWLLADRLQSICSLRAFLMRRSLMNLFNEYSQDMVYVFQDYFDNDVYQELTRMHRTLFYALDDWYNIGFRKRSLEEVLSEDLFLDEKGPETEEVKAMAKYIEDQRAKLASLKLDQLVNFHIDWGRTEAL